MTNEQAIEILKAHHMWTGEPQEIIDVRKENKALEMAIQSLSQEPCRVKNELNVELNELKPCTDAVSRDAILEGLKGCICEEWIKTLFATMVKQLPSVTQKPIECDDAVSREGLKTSIHNFYYGLKHTPTEEDIQAYIDVAPPVTQNSGKWISLENRFELGDRVRCSNCGQVFVVGDDVSRHFCPNCGARMVEPQESEDK